MTSSCSHWHSLHLYSLSSLRLVSPPYSQLCVIATDRCLGSCLLSYSTGLFVCLFVCIQGFHVSLAGHYILINQTHKTAARSHFIVAYLKQMTVVFMSQLCTCFLLLLFGTLKVLVSRDVFFSYFPRVFRYISRVRLCEREPINSLFHNRHNKIIYFYPPRKLAQ